jgi:hypothetical protein
MCSAYLARRTRPLAIMPSADQVPVKSPHSRCTGTCGLSLSPDRPALHYVLFALPTVPTTFSSYGDVGRHRQAEIILSLGRTEPRAGLSSEARPTVANRFSTRRSKDRLGNSSIYGCTRQLELFTLILRIGV